MQVLVFAIPPNAGANGLPLQSLVGVQKFALVPNGSTSASFGFSAFDFSIVGTDGAFQAVKGQWTIRFGNDGPTVAVTMD